jgi:hypothetical protein
MLRKPVLGAVVMATAMFVGSPAPIFTGFAIEAAQAKDYYTRKRVNGQWITGKFYYKDRKPTDEAVAASPHPAPPPRPETTEPPESPDAYMDRLRVALEVKAKEMLSRQPAIPDTIVIDAAAGIKTTFFSDGTVREEPLEPTRTGSVVLAN